MGIAGLLLVLFVGLKLGHVIDWSWWWVLSPAIVWFVLICVYAVIKVQRGSGY